MVNCQDFKQWLVHQDSADEHAFRQMKVHIQDCQTCNALYQTDMALDAMLEKGMQAVDPPPGLITRARRGIEPESRSKSIGWLRASWKTAVPALSMAALVLIVMFNTFTGRLQSVDEVAAHGISNHLDANMKMDFLAEEVTEVAQWFTQRLRHEVRLPDLNRLGLKLQGGRKCTLGKVDAALLFCDSQGKRASLFVIHQKNVSADFNRKRKYIVEEGDYKVTVWKNAGMVYALVT